MTTPQNPSDEQQLDTSETTTAAAPMPPGDDESRGRGEGAGQAKEVEGLSQGQIVLRRFLRHRAALIGMITIVCIALLSFTSMGLGPIPGWWKYQDPNATMDVQNQGQPTLRMPWDAGGFSFGDHPFGQDTLGADNFALVMTGVQTSLLVMVVIAIVASTIGVTVGALSGYYRGWVDAVLMRFTDLVITVPVLIIGAVLGKLITVLPDKYHFSQGAKDLIRDNMPLLLGLALGMLVWTGLARLTRSEFLRLRELEFVDAARVSGASDFRIIGKHILPNAVGVVIVNVTLLMASSVVLESALSFLEFGINFPNVSLGRLISLYQSAFATRPWLFWWPGLFIILLALSVNLIGDGLRDAFDPRTKRIPSQRAMAKAAQEDEERRRTIEAETVAAGNIALTNTELEDTKKEERQ